MERRALGERALGAARLGGMGGEWSLPAWVGEGVPGMVGCPMEWVGGRSVRLLPEASFVPCVGAVLGRKRRGGLAPVSAGCLALFFLCSWIGLLNVGRPESGFANSWVLRLSRPANKLRGFVSAIPVVLSFMPLL